MTIILREFIAPFEINTVLHYLQEFCNNPGGDEINPPPLGISGPIIPDSTDKPVTLYWPTHVGRGSKMVLIPRGNKTHIELKSKIRIRDVLLYRVLLKKLNSWDPIEPMVEEGPESDVRSDYPQPQIVFTLEEVRFILGRKVHASTYARLDKTLWYLSKRPELITLSLKNLLGVTVRQVERYKDDLRQLQHLPIEY